MRVGPSGPRRAIEGAHVLERAAQLDVAGIGSLIDEENDEILYCSIKALSIFVTDVVSVVGF